MNSEEQMSDETKKGLHKVEIIHDPSKPWGQSTRVLLDGEMVRGCVRYTLTQSAEAVRVPTLTLEMFVADTRIILLGDAIVHRVAYPRWRAALARWRYWLGIDPAYREPAP